ncbi:elongation factor 1-alpha C-terminal domain-related protein, partial [Saezia sanguinis]|uniref:elongation factor 1-alpha C-terminal domain-related protein n=2 Tax=Bacteria TaxID=2 RepID=UPI0038576A2F
CWFSDEAELRPGASYTVRHTTRSVTAEIRSLDYRLDVNTLHRDENANTLALNQIGRVQLRTRQALQFDPYRRNRTTGSFLLVDDATGDTVGAGMITGPS